MHALVAGFTPFDTVSAAGITEYIILGIVNGGPGWRVRSASASTMLLVTYVPLSVTIIAPLDEETVLFEITIGMAPAGHHHYDSFRQGCTSRRKYYKQCYS